MARTVRRFPQHINASDYPESFVRSQLQNISWSLLGHASGDDVISKMVHPEFMLPRKDLKKLANKSARRNARRLIMAAAIED